jgi:folate-binding protein YgfZ
MTLPLATRLSHRSLIRLGGADRLAFLQNIVSNDVAKATPTQAVYAALLTPQGKFLHDMFIVAAGDAFLVDCEAERAEDLLHRLTAYKLRSKVTFDNLADAFDVWAVWSGSLANAFPDPRLPELGSRLFIAKGETPQGITPTDFTAHDTHRIQLGVANGSRDMIVEKSTLAEGNVDFLNGVDWKKGCYIGQELTARMHYRGLAKKRLFPVRIEGESLESGANLDKESGEMRSVCGNQGLALLRIEAVQKSLDEKTPLTCGNTKLWPQIPAWMKLT